ncbi:6-O-methylguanine DNA methyltransferase [Apiosordaria backusii]|uniref:Methylated-DNA--protein-cysteine methyltransferase n=1 Tax=Apiosordaria backusii TaxID=314023 RepID=A0AA40EZQ1_9PEZI|nr:6-O-methylguanine DNA methyltransferase [Apiosordaria backusii]
MATLTAPPTAAFTFTSSSKDSPITNSPFASSSTPPSSLPSTLPPTTTTLTTPTSTTTTTKRKHSLISTAPPQEKPPNYSHQITTSPSITPFEKKVYHLLLTIPPGSFTTYAFLSAHLKSSPRAVGNALRKNPFAPGVPCHRVLSTGNALGGFKGKISRKSADGVGGVDTLIEKKTLLQKEGVRFDDKGRALGTPFRGFK